MNHIAPRAEPLIREIPLSKLALAPENVRRTPPDPQADAELKASIAALGLLENLVVRTEGPDEDDRYAVVAGGRRLKAMQALAGDGVLDADHPVPCLVKPEGIAPGEVSLAENVVRIAMHPADQVVAFADLTGAGLSVAAIAARFGMSERLVEQRLRLGNAAPELMDVYRADEIDLEVLKAFAVTTDRERQMAVWEQVAGQGYRPSAWQVKRLLTEERVPGASAVARFVGVEAYEAAGGQVLRDLFARVDESGVWFEDPVLLEKLATGKLQAAADELSTRWKWATAMIDVAWGDTARYGRIEPQPAERSPEEQAEIGKLEARQAELAELDDDEWTQETVTEAEAIETRLDEIEGAVEARAMWRREDFSIAGCIVTVAHDGTLQVIQGLVKPEDMPKDTESADAASDADNGDGTDAVTHRVHVPGTSVSAPMALPKDREAEARKEVGVGIGLADDLRSIRTALVKAYLAGDFEAAFDLMLFQMGRSVFTDGYKAHALDIAVRETADRPTMRMNDEDFASWSPGEAMLADRSGVAMDWLEIEDDGESFAALRALPQADKKALFAACVARTVKPQLAFEPQARPELEATVARLGIEFAQHVRPTAAMLWSRIAKARILDIARCVIGISWASARAKTKKAALAEAMETAFAAGEPPVGLSAQMHDRGARLDAAGVRRVRHRAHRGRGGRHSAGGDGATSGYRRGRSRRRTGGHGSGRRVRGGPGGCFARRQRSCRAGRTGIRTLGRGCRGCGQRRHRGDRRRSCHRWGAGRHRRPCRSGQRPRPGPGPGQGPDGYSRVPAPRPLTVRRHPTPRPVQCRAGRFPFAPLITEVPA